MRADKIKIEDLEAQRARGHYGLVFQPELEQPFRAYYLRFMRRHVFSAQVAAIILSLLAVLVEVVFVQPPASVQAAFIVIFLLAIPAGVILSLLYLRSSTQALGLQWLSALVVLCSLGSAFYLEALYRLDGLRYGYQTITFVLIFNFLLLGLRYYQAQALALSGLAVYAVVLLALDTPAADLTHALYNYVAVGTLASTAGYMQEYIVRTNFLDRGIRRHQALHDRLTGLLNRHGLEVHAERSWRRATREAVPVAVAVFDIDWFKHYNDELGHPAGDACLARVADALLQHVGRPLDCAARLGGEEFAVVWYDVDHEAAAKLGERFREAVESLRIAHPAHVCEWVTLSGGVTVVRPADGATLSAAILTADAALYEAKRAGRNRITVAGSTADST